MAAVRSSVVEYAGGREALETLCMWTGTRRVTRREWKAAARTGRRQVLYCRGWSWLRRSGGMFLGRMKKSNCNVG